MLNSPVWRDRGARYYFCGGLLLGALATALGLLVVGSLVRLALPAQVWRWMLAAVAVALVARELGLVRFWLPQNKRLVPEHVNRHGKALGPLQFGFEMGTSLRTYTPSALPHAVALVVAVIAWPAAAVLAGLGFGLGRSAMTLANLNFSRDNSWDMVWLAHERLIRAALVLGFVSAFAVVVLFP